MALSLRDINELANTTTFRERVRAAVALESEERSVTNAVASASLMEACVGNSDALSGHCYRAAFALRNVADPLAITDSQIRNAITAVMNRLYP